MKEFLVLYCMPSAGLEGWMKKPEEERKAEEERMKADWDSWMEEHGSMFIGKTAGAGKTKRITAEGIADTKNDVMLYSIAQGESHDAVAAVFAGHPHLQIPGAWIDVMPANYLPGME